MACLRIENDILYKGVLSNLEKQNQHKMYIVKLGKDTLIIN